MGLSLEEKLETVFCQLIVDVKNMEEAKALLSDALTGAERAAIVNRLSVAILLTNKESYDNIKRKLHVSSAMIAKVQESLDTPGMKLAVEKVKIDDWAGKWAKRLVSLFEKFLGK